MSLIYGYTQNGANNGQPTSITDGVDSGRTVSYTFDSLKRLTAASTTGSTNYAAWGLSWTYDRYSNRTAQSATVGSPPSNSTPVNSANQVTGIGSSTFSYDANGNLTQDDNYQYTYDAENRLVQAQLKNGGAVQATYAFDGNGKRAVKVAPQQTGSNRTFSIYAGSRIVSEFSDASTATYTTGTTPGQAPSETVSLLLYQHSDHMSTRMATDQQGNVAEQKGHYPYGDSWYETGGAMGSVPRKFSKYMIETELPNSALHSSLAREHSARLGRFHSPDRRSAGQFNPQRMNRYAYASNDPINRWDPRGLQDLACSDDCWEIGDDQGGGALPPDMPPPDSPPPDDPICQADPTSLGCPGSDGPTPPDPPITPDPPAPPDPPPDQTPPQNCPWYDPSCLLPNYTQCNDAKQQCYNKADNSKQTASDLIDLVSSDLDLGCQVICLAAYGFAFDDPRYWTCVNTCQKAVSYATKAASLINDATYITAKATCDVEFWVCLVVGPPTQP